MNLHPTPTLLPALLALCLAAPVTAGPIHVQDVGGSGGGSGAVVVTAWFPDADGDGHGDPDAAIYSVTQPDSYVALGDDCDDSDPTVHPGAPELCDGVDHNCDGVIESSVQDTDADGVPDCADPDDDADGVVDQADNCPLTYNPIQGDLDGDGIGDACDTDADGDGEPDLSDCAPLDPSVYPGAPEVCDGVDNDCNGQVDEGFPDTDGDSYANCVDWDDDADGIGDAADNCPLVYNPVQRDTDGDGIGDACDADDDADGEPDVSDCDPLNPAVYPGAVEICDGVDNDCDGLVDEGFRDTDGDGKADCVDTDDDADGVQDAIDNCPWVYNPLQEDTDGDGVGDACLQDSDGDGEPDYSDCAPLDPEVFAGAPEVCDGLDNDCDGYVDEGFPDLDGDGVRDCVDTDDDADGRLDVYDNCPLAYNPVQLDLDGDGVGDVCDPDVDGDGVPNAADCEPMNPRIGEGLVELCDGVDNDCDGLVDEQCRQIGVGDDAGPARMALLPASPNPVRSRAVIGFQVPAGGARVELEIFDIGGRRIATLVEGEVSGGFHTVTWDGRDAGGRPAAAGLYFYRLRGPGFQDVRKLALVH